MRRVIGWSIPLVLIMFGLLWPLVFTGGGSAGRPPTTRWCSAISRPTSASTPTAAWTPSRRSPPSSPAGATASSGTGTSPTRTTPTCGRYPRSPRSCSTARPAPYQMLWEDGKRFRVAKIGDPDEYLSYGTHVFEIRYTMPGVLDPGDTGARQEIRRLHRRGRRRAVGVLLERRRRRRGTTGSSRSTSPSRCPSDVTGAQCSVGFGVGRACGDLTVTGNKVTLSAALPAAAHAGHGARRSRRADPAARPSCRGPTPGIGSSASR